MILVKPKSSKKGIAFLSEIASIQLLNYNYALMIQKILFTHNLLNKKVIFTASVEINDKINPYIKLNVHLHKVKI